jgi:hypothetical protein
LAAGIADAEGLRQMQAGMAKMAPHREAFGADRYDELKALLIAVEKLPVFVEPPVTVPHEPMFGHEHER